LLIFNNIYVAMTLIVVLANYPLFLILYPNENEYTTNH